MSYRIKILLPFLCVSTMLLAQINPPQGSKLNYTQVMFEYDKVPDADCYTIQICYEDTSGSFTKVLKEQKDNSTATLISGLQFGKKYMWRCAAYKHGSQIALHGPNHFETDSIPVIEMNYLRCNVLKNDTAKNAKGVLCVDFAKTVFDRNGNLIWFLPELNKKFTNASGAKDLRISNAGTMLFFANNTANECDLNGNVIWKAPNNGKVSKDSTEYYHHDFRKLKNGNYMVLGEKYSWRDIPPDVNIRKFKPENVESTGTGRRVKILFGTIIQYDKNGKVVWVWDSGDYFSDKDIFAAETTTNNPRRDLPGNAEIFGHLNALDVDTNEKFVYAAFRDISRVVKIEMLTSKVVDSWGAKLPSGEANEGNDYFKNQHDVSIMPNNDILVFNNNGLRDTGNTSTVVEFSQRKEKERSKITWTFDCKFDTLTNGKSARNGGVDYLPNDNMLICMGALCRASEVVKITKEVVWDAFFETKGAENAPWVPTPLYRTHWNTSLYPCYFTVQQNQDMVVEKKPMVSFTIYNEGTNADNYFVKITPASSVKNSYTQTAVILPGKSKSIDINVDMIPLKTETITVDIISKANTDLKKKLSFKVAR